MAGFEQDQDMVSCRVRTRLLPAALAALCLADGGTSSAGAQGIVAPLTSSCDASVSCSYEQCALWLEGLKVRRGLGGEVLARPPVFLGAMPLASLVTGDSARHYARLYERDARRANVLGLVGLGMTIAAIVTMASHECDRSSPFGSCSSSDDIHLFAGTALILGSLGVTLATIPLHRRAWRNAGKSVFWNNARFARP